MEQERNPDEVRALAREMRRQQPWWRRNLGLLSLLIPVTIFIIIPGIWLAYVLISASSTHSSASSDSTPYTAPSAQVPSGPMLQPTTTTTPDLPVLQPLPPPPNTDTERVISAAASPSTGKIAFADSPEFAQANYDTQVHATQAAALANCRAGGATDCGLIPNGLGLMMIYRGAHSAAGGWTQQGVCVVVEPGIPGITSFDATSTPSLDSIMPNVTVLASHCLKNPMA